jgi:hypothetical protein
VDYVQIATALFADAAECRAPEGFWAKISALISVSEIGSKNPQPLEEFF